MCGRFFIDKAIEQTARRQLQQIYDQQTVDSWKTGDMYPGNLCLAIDNQNRPALMNWGYDLFSRNIINTRLESVMEKDFYRLPFSRYRCLIMASGFYEWDQNKKRHFIKANDDLFYMAAIFQPTEKFSRFSIITKPATQSLHIHDRVPVVFNRQQASQYLMSPDIQQMMDISPVLLID